MKQTRRLPNPDSRSPTFVLFDFDGTLSSGDSAALFIFYCFRHSVRPWLFLPVVLSGFAVHLLAWVSRLFMGTDKCRVRRIDILWREMVRCFITPGMVKKFAPAFIKLHRVDRFGWAAEQVAKERDAGNTVILTTGGPSCLLFALAADMGFDYIICSEMEPAQPWKFRFFNYGANKIVSLCALQSSEFRVQSSDKNNCTLNSALCTLNIIRAYSDSSSDIPMMSLAREQVWINPRTGCRVEK